MPMCLYIHADKWPSFAPPLLIRRGFLSTGSVSGNCEGVFLAPAPLSRRCDSIPRVYMHSDTKRTQNPRNRWNFNAYSHFGTIPKNYILGIDADTYADALNMYPFTGMHGALFCVFSDFFGVSR